MSWLSGQELEDAINTYGNDATCKAFDGVYSMDQLPFAVAQYPFFMIVNKKLLFEGSFSMNVNWTC